jgi:hypothetical protein
LSVPEALELTLMTLPASSRQWLERCAGACEAAAREREGAARELAFRASDGLGGGGGGGEGSGGGGGGGGASGAGGAGGAAGAAAAGDAAAAAAEAREAAGDEAVEARRCRQRAQEVRWQLGQFAAWAVEVGPAPPADHALVVEGLVEGPEGHEWELEI